MKSATLHRKKTSSSWQGILFFIFISLGMIIVFMTMFYGILHVFGMNK